MTQLNRYVEEVTQRIIDRSADLRADYLAQIAEDHNNRPERGKLSCGNLAHGFAACDAGDKSSLRMMESGNMAIVTAYNDMLSAHQPYAEYPEIIKRAMRDIGCTAQVAGGVPAMCDGVTQGQDGMELSLLSRDIIAQCTAISLSHQMFDGVLALGICDKIVPGLLIGVLSFGYLPAIFIPAGPMESGLKNKEKQRIRQLFAEGKIGREELLQAESDSYHSAGTCTFYGTANSNQVLLEALGLQLPGSSFVNPSDPMRQRLTVEACHQLTRVTALGSDYRPVGEIVDERSIVNATVSLLASGGSTNHTMHLVAIARAAGIIVNWDDIAELSAVVPLLAKVYPNGEADVNHFHAAGGTSCMFRQLLDAGFMHGDAKTVWGENFSSFTQESFIEDDKIVWRESPEKPLDLEVLTTTVQPFSKEGGIRLLAGNIGRGVIKVSAVAPEHQVIEAPAIVLDDQDKLEGMFKAGLLNRDCVVVVRYQGPKALGMPELHKLTPFLGILQDKGYKVALVTDGRMSGASGKVPAAIHLVPEAVDGGLLAKLQNGDLIRVDAVSGQIECLEDMNVVNSREAAPNPKGNQRGCGRELFAVNRDNISNAEQGASYLFAGE
ncbi:phosphogluconate dehydratase [Porticoccaceae bacterium]|jgi:phosphogluconate dehydratase|nr:phosphogluconate dehydratase [Porticoccaceae bacterium]MBT4212733.1 phosphogluconate dehydratase [Porticoccaceae bacterium]MBT7947514.1 phosphogluconate dehydratase [Porticoccaceae bacterium]MDB3884753.1 phosphogluconate dehydratase [Porticoccaceae bacterium]MDC3200211.1 phosphogluconate dehydratase [Porticoccaceae bacterium]